MAEGQAISGEGRFSVDFDRGCAPFTVHIEELDDFGNITRQYIYEDGLAETSDTTYTYTVPGTYAIVQIVGIDVNPKTDTLVVEVLESRAPTFDLLKCDLNSVQLTLTDSYYTDYIVTFDANNEQLLSAGADPVIFAYDSSGTKTISVQGSFSGTDTNCGATQEDIVIGPFDNNGSITDVDLTRNCLSNVNATVYVSVDPQQLYQVEYRAGTSNYTLLYEGPITADSLYFPEFSSSTDRRICFRLNAVSACTDEVVDGSNFCVDNLNAVEPEISNAYASYVEGGILLAFDEVAVGGFFGEREVVGFDPERLDTLYPGYIDRNVSPFRAYTYEIGFADSCGNVIEPITIQPSFVSAKETRINHHLVSWNPPGNQLTDNFLHTLVVSGAGLEKTINNPDNPVEIFLEEPFGPLQEVFLRTVYVDGTILESNRVPIDYVYRAYIPDGFTPNGDFLNDELRIVGLANDEIDWKIYNRWGEVIFTSQSAELGWDGRYRGSLAPGGVYFYDLIFLNAENERIRQRGSFVLIRN